MVAGGSVVLEVFRYAILFLVWACSQLISSPGSNVCFCFVLRPHAGTGPTPPREMDSSMHQPLVCDRSIDAMQCDLSMCDDPTPRSPLPFLPPLAPGH